MPDLTPLIPAGRRGRPARAALPSRRCARIALAAAVFACPWSGVATTEVHAETGAAAHESYVYRIGPFDTIDIRVEGHPDLSVSVPVRPDGRVSLPLIDDLLVADRTAEEVARDIERELDAYVRAPTVTVAVSRAVGTFEDQIRVVGTAPGPEVRGEGPGAVRSVLPVEPRSIPYRDGITLIDVITELGGLSPFAAGNSAYILRRDGERTSQIPVRLDDLVDSGDWTANVRMAPGDVLIIPQGALSGDWRLEYGAGAFLTYTDNVNLDPDDLKEGALITTLRPSFSILGTTPRFFGRFDIDFNLQFREVLGDNIRGVEEGFDPFVDLLGTASIEAAPDVLFIDTSASITQQSSGIGDATSVSQANQTNRQPVLGFRFSPYVPARFGDLAEAQLRYTFNGFVRGEDDSNITDAFTEAGETSIRNALGLSVDSGPGTSEYGAWTFTTTGSIQSREDDGDVNRAEVRLDWAYPVTRQIFALAGGGWQYFDDGNPDNEISAPVYAVGARWVPSPNLTMTATVGQRDDRFNLFFNFQYDISPKTRVFASYVEGLTNAAETIVGNTSFLQIDPITGEFRDTRTGAAFNPGFPGTVDTDTSFNRTFVFGFNTIQGRDVFGLNGRIFSEEPEDRGDEQTRFDIFGTWSRQLTLKTGANVVLGYRHNDLSTRTDDTVEARASLTHSLYRTINAFVSYGFQNRASSEDAFEFTENVVTVGVSGTF